LRAVKLECRDREYNEFDNFDVLFTSPETLERHYITIRHLQDRIIGVVIDESHCVVNW
jgi:superfamily II DNA helicase RecQ